MNHMPAYHRCVCVQFDRYTVQMLQYHHPYIHTHLHPGIFPSCLSVGEDGEVEGDRGQVSPMSTSGWQWPGCGKDCVQGEDVRVRGVTMHQNVDGAQLFTTFLSHSKADDAGYLPNTSCAVGDSLHYLALLIRFIDGLCMPIARFEWRERNTVRFLHSRFHPICC